MTEEANYKFARDLGTRIANTQREINNDQISLNQMCDTIIQNNIQGDSGMNESNANMQLLLSFSSLLRKSRQSLLDNERDLAELRKPIYRVKPESIDRFDIGIQKLKRKFAQIENRAPPSVVNFVSTNATSYTPDFSEHVEAKGKTTTQILDEADRKEKERAEDIDELARAVDKQHASVVRLEETVTQSVEKIDEISNTVKIVDENLGQAIDEVNATTKMVKKDRACMWIWIDIALFALCIILFGLNGMDFFKH